MKSVLVIGMGILGRHLARKMQELGNQVMIIDEDEEVIQELSQEFQDAIVGDCTVPGVLSSLDVPSFDYCFVSIGENFYASLEITSILKDLGAQFVVSKAKRDRQADFLKKIGADEVFFPERETGERLAVRYTSEDIFDFIKLTAEYSIFEISVPPDWTGKTIIDVDVRKKYHINIIAIKKEAGLNPAPGGNYRFLADDHLVVIGKSSDVFQLTAQYE